MQKKLLNFGLIPEQKMETGGLMMPFQIFRRQLTQLPIPVGRSDGFGKCGAENFLGPFGTGFARFRNCFCVSASVFSLEKLGIFALICLDPMHLYSRSAILSTLFLL
jgi:hypothetical protein